jgi:hypothetical protein
VRTRRRQGEAPSLLMLDAGVVAYALVEEGVEYTGRLDLVVDGKHLGPVPRLAICQAILEDELFLCHCDDSWKVLGVTGGLPSLEEAIRTAERGYRGSANRWVLTGLTRLSASDLATESTRHLVCSFCGRGPKELDALIEARGARLCNHCLRDYASWLDSSV